jgi:hypothetical protein
VMGSDVSPFVEFFQVSEPSLIRTVMACHREVKTETVEVGFQILDVWIPAIELPVSRKLLLNQHLQSWPDFRGDNLGAFSVEVAAVALKVG